MDEQIFNFSEETIKERKKRIYAMTAVMPLIIVIFSYIFSSMRGITDLRLMFIVIAITLPLILIEMIIASKTMFKKLRDTRLVIGSEMLERKGGKFEEIVYYQYINSIDVRRGKKGSILFIKLKSSGRTINISGFDNMEAVLSILKERVPDLQDIKEKQYKVDWDNPLILILTMIITAVVIIAIIKAGANLYGLFNFVFMTVMAVVFLFYKPISRNAGARFRKFEIIVSIIMLACIALIAAGNIILFFA